jgi:hypothetical protein
VKLQLLKVQGLCRVCGTDVLEHNHDLVTLGHSHLSEDVMSTAMDMLKVGVDTNPILDFTHLRTGRQLRRFELAALDPVDVRPVLSKNTDDLFGYIEAQGRCLIVELPIVGEQEHAAVLTMAREEHEKLMRIGNIASLDETEVRNPLGWMTYPIILVDDEKSIISGGLLFTAYEREEIFDWPFSS